jgi:hypothetical protein
VSAALSDPNDGVVGYLIDPEGEAVASSSNITLDSTASNAILTGSLNVYKDNPEPGRWTFALDWLPPMDPDLEASNPGNGDSASLDIDPGGGEVAPGLWFLNPSGIGPYGPGGAPSETASAGFGAVTQAFDPTVDTSSRGRAPRFRSRSRRQPARERTSPGSSTSTTRSSSTTSARSPSSRAATSSRRFRSATRSSRTAQ